MESIAKVLSLKHQPFFLSPHPHNHHIPLHPSLSSISFRPHSFRSSLSLKITSQDSHPPLQNPKPLLSFLKTPISVAIAATALFLSFLGRRPFPAVAAPVTETAPVVETSFSSEESEKSLEDRVASNPDDVQSLKSLMEVKIKNKKLQESVEVINRLIELEPEDYEWPILRSHIYSYMGESELARTGFEEILAKDPLRVEAFHGLVMAVSQGEDSRGGELDEVMKRIQGAMERCKKEKMREDARDFKLLIAQVRVIRGEYNEALRVYEELVKEEPRDFRPYLCQGIIYTLLRKQDEAEKQFDKYKRLVPKGHPYARYFDDNMFATKVFSQMAENERAKMG